MTIRSQRCRRLGCNELGAKPVERKSPNGATITTYLCPRCIIVAESGHKEIETIGAVVPPKDRDSEPVSLAQRRLAKGTGDKPDKEPA